MIINEPNISVVYFRYLLIRATNFVDCVIKPPIMRNGMPNPNEYARRRLNATLGVVAASVSIVPKIESPKGVQNINEICNALKTNEKAVMLDHDDLFSNIIRNNQDKSTFRLISYSILW